MLCERVGVCVCVRLCPELLDGMGTNRKVTLKGIFPERFLIDALVAALC